MRLPAHSLLCTQGGWWDSWIRRSPRSSCDGSTAGAVVELQWLRCQQMRGVRRLLAAFAGTGLEKQPRFSPTFPSISFLLSDCCPPVVRRSCGGPLPFFKNQTARPETLGLTLESAAHDTLMPNAVALLTTCCTESASLTAIDATVAHRLCDAAVAMLCKPNQSSENTTGALDWLAALLQDDRARRHVTKCAADLFGRVVAHLDATFAAQDMAGLSSATSVLVMGCNHSALRNHVAKHCLPSIMATTLAAAQILKGAKAGSPAQVFAQGASVACLTAAYNATGDSASALQTPEWLAMLAQHLGTTTTSPVAPMVLNVLSRICKTEDGVAYAAKELPQLVETIIHHAAVTDLSVQKPAARLLAQLARASVACRRRIAAPAQRSVLLDLLKHPDTSVTGNAALCLADCCHDSAVCADLVGTDIVATLLDYAKQDKSALQGNSAIALARLAQGHKAHLLRLKELRGIEILQSRMPKP
eukprot:m.207554 g.207554  ORF g.207554 m.207554 type:complete len:474 (+) comp18523_c0_seq4:1314-2735(+)